MKGINILTFIITLILLIDNVNAIIVDKNTEFQVLNAKIILEKPLFFNKITIDNNIITFDNVSFIFNKYNDITIKIKYLFDGYIKFRVEANGAGSFTISLPYNYYIINIDDVSKIEYTNNIKISYYGTTEVTISSSEYVNFHETSRAWDHEVAGFFLFVYKTKPIYLIVNITPYEPIYFDEIKFGGIILYEDIWVNDTLLIHVPKTIFDKIMNERTLAIDFKAWNWTGYHIEYHYYHVDLYKSLKTIKVVSETTFKPLNNIKIITYDLFFNKIDSNTTNVNGTCNITVPPIGFIEAIDENTGIKRLLKIDDLQKNDYIIYFPDENPIFIEFIINDYTGKFNGGYILIKKYINDSLVTIDCKRITNDYTTQHHLESYEHYYIYIIDKSLKEVRAIGYFSSGISKTSTINIFEVSFEEVKISDIVNYEIKTTDSNIIINYNITKGEHVDVSIVITDEQNNIVHKVTSNQKQGSFIFTRDKNKEYTIDIKVTTEHGVHSAKYLVINESVKKVYIDAPDWVRNLLFGGLCVFIALTLSKKSVQAALLLSTLTACLFVSLGLLDLPIEVLATLIILTVLSFFIKRGD